MKSENIIAAALITPMLLGIGGIAYAYVYDLDPVHIEKEYCLEKECFDRSNCDWNREFPDFPSWLEERHQAESKLARFVDEKIEQYSRENVEMWEGIGQMFGFDPPDSRDRGE